MQVISIFALLRSFQFSLWNIIFIDRQKLLMPSVGRYGMYETPLCHNQITNFSWTINYLIITVQIVILKKKEKEKLLLLIKCK